ncbi:MAG: integrin alpha, partial [Candidatus Limnocylindria bacterium]
AAMMIAPTAGLAADFNTPFDVFTVESPLTAANARFPERLATADDLTGDGVNDIYASSYVIPVAGKTGAGAVYLIDGATRAVVRTINEPDPQTNSNFGFYITTPGDLNGDGKGDLVVGASGRPVYTGVGPACGQPEPNGCNERQGAAYAFSGATGALLRTLANPNPQPDAVFGSRAAGAGDINGDSVTDLLIGASSNDIPTGCGEQTPIPAGCRRNEGEAFIFSGSNGALLRQMNVPTADKLPDTCSQFSRCGNFGGTVQSPGDINRDGVADQLVDAFSLKPTPDRSGRMYLYSGSTGNLLATLDQPVPGGITNSSFWGLQDVENGSPGDVTADGVPDIFIGGFLQPGANGESGAGRAWVFDGRATVTAGTGVVAYEAKDPDPQQNEGYGFTERKTDYNKDGRLDLFVSSLSGAATSVVILDGRDGSTLLKQLLRPAADNQVPVMGNPGPTFGQGVSAPGDLNRDGEPDYAVTAHSLDIGDNVNQGRIYFYLSKVPAPPVVTPPVVTPPVVTPPVVTPPVVTPPPPPAIVRRRGKLSATVTPSRRLTPPFVFKTTGKLTLPIGIKTLAGCKGRVSVQIKRGKVTISTRRVSLSKSCKYSSKVSFANRRRFGSVKRLKFTVRFVGNASVARTTAATRFARVAR